MFQTIQGQYGFVVDLKDFPPELPINDGGMSLLTPYAQALNDAIIRGIVKEPGKYFIVVFHGGPIITPWTIHKIIE